VVSARSTSRRIIVAVTLLGLTGCYTMQPVTEQPFPLGITVELVINDAGRAALRPMMGPEVAKVRGRLVQKDSVGYTLAVTQLGLMRDGTQVWSGERVSIKSEYVNSVTERRFSRARTAVVTAAVLGVIAIVFTQSIKGSLFGDDGKVPSDTAVAVRYPRFQR
jgi:hypothetical protein